MQSWLSLRFEFTAMASPCEIVLEGRDEGGMRASANAAMTEVHRIETKFSRYLESSVVSRINAAAGSATFVEVDDETSALLDFAGSLWQSSHGLFDATSGVLRRAWDFRSQRMPRPGELEALLPLVGWDKFERRDRQVRLAHAGMELDFGGFGKEYAADRAAAILLAQGQRNGLVNLGGDIHVLGPHAMPGEEGKPWQIAIAHPRATHDGQPLATLGLAAGGLATSGDYERFFELEGRRYCHILDPRTGWPADAWQSISVTAGNTTSAGALCTIAMLKGDGAIDWLQSQACGFLAVRADGSMFEACVPTS